MTASTYKSLTIKVNDGIARLSFSRPELFNRFDLIQHGEFPRALEEIRKTPEVRVLIITGEGKAFSAGGDFDMVLEANQNRDLRLQLESEAQHIFSELTSMPFPIIVAMNGAAVGLGASVVALADIVVAWKGAKIADPHVHLGLVAGDGGIFGWSQSVGLAKAKRYLLTGDTLTAKEAQDIGLISDLINDPDDVVEAANKLAKRIAVLPASAVQGTKRAFNRLTQQFNGAVFDLGLSYEMEAMTSPDVVDAINHLKNK